MKSRDQGQAPSATAARHLSSRGGNGAPLAQRAAGRHVLGCFLRHCVKLRHDLLDRRQRRSKATPGSRGPLFNGHFVIALLSMTRTIQARPVGALQMSAQRDCYQKFVTERSTWGKRQFARPRWLAVTGRRSLRQEAAAAHLSAALGTSISTSSVDTWLPRSILTLIFSGSSVI